LSCIKFFIGSEYRETCETSPLERSLLYIDRMTGIFSVTVGVDVRTMLTGRFEQLTVKPTIVNASTSEIIFENMFPSINNRPKTCIINLFPKNPHMPSWFFAIRMTHQLSIARHLMFQASHQRWARRQIHPALAVQYSLNGLLSLFLHAVN